MQSNIKQNLSTEYLVFDFKSNHNRGKTHTKNMDNHIVLDSFNTA